MTMTYDLAAATGRCLDQRYRLDALVRREAGASCWRGTDNVLRRTVAVQVFEPELARESDIFGAVRRASRITHGGLAQVFDANESAELPYVVGEWVDGRDLAGMLTVGPLDPRRAADAFQQASVALAAAHAAGSHHLRLTSRSVVWSDDGPIKVLGLGVDAALADVHADEPVLTDTRDLGRLLFAALAGRCRRGDAVVRPTWTQATRAWLARNLGASRELAAIARRALAGARDDDQPIRSPAQLAAELQQLASHPVEARVPAIAGIGEPNPVLARARTRTSSRFVSTRPIRPVRADSADGRVAA